MHQADYHLDIFIKFRKFNNNTTLSSSDMGSYRKLAKQIQTEWEKKKITSDFMKLGVGFRSCMHAWKKFRGNARILFYFILLGRDVERR